MSCKDFFEKITSRVGTARFRRLFFDKKFVHYTWIGISISLINVFLLWLFIDILGIPTVVSSFIVVFGTFLLRYVLFDIFKII